MSKIHRVTAGKYLHLPQEIGGRDRLWLAPGGAVDLADPFVAHAVEGQEYKLAHDPDAQVADALPMRLIRLRDEFMRNLTGEPPPPTKAEELVAVGAPAAGEIPLPDIRKAKKG